MLNPYSDEQHKWYYKEQTAFGTAIALSASGYKGVYFEKTQFPDYGVNLSELGNNRSSRVLADTDFYSDNYSKTGPVPFTMRMSLDRVADFVYAVTQNRVSQGAVGTGYQKIYRPHASGPDFTSNAGLFQTWVHVDPISGRCVRYTDCIISDLTFTLTKEQVGEQNIVRVTGNILPRKVDIDQTFTGTVTEQGSTYLLAHEFIPDLTVVGSGGSTQYVPNWPMSSISINNSAVGIDKNSSGNPVTWFLNFGNGLKCNFTTWYDSTSADSIYSLRNGQVVILLLTRGTINTSGYVQFDMRGRITNNPMESSNNQMRVLLDLQLVNTTASTTDALTITVADAISQT